MELLHVCLYLILLGAITGGWLRVLRTNMERIRNYGSNRLHRGLMMWAHFEIVGGTFAWATLSVYLVYHIFKGL